MRKKSTILLVSLLLNMFAFAEDWNWEELDNENLNFPSNFLWGSATAEYQNSGADTCKDNNWATWENSYDDNSNPRIKLNQKSGTSTDYWNLYKEDIQLMKDFGLNAYRFSIEWSLIEPVEGTFDSNAMKHYQDVIDELISKGIAPMITLHHFTNPNWFQEKGSFEKEENIEYFVRFCSYVFDHLSDRVNLWCTINEPSLYSFMGYMLGEFPPGEKNYQKAAEVLKNLLIAHCKVYENLKEKPNGEKAQIGIAHNMLKMTPYHWWNLVEVVPCNYLNTFINDTVLNFFKTGSFYFYMPLKAYVTQKYSNPKLDFIGLNYYSDPLIKMQMSLSEPLHSSCYAGEEMSECHYRFYPEGLYEAIKDVSLLNLPIYITENGIADSDDTKRPIYIKRYLIALSKAIEDGYDIRGYFYWTLIDNFEWHEGYIQKFGLYDVNLLTKNRTIKPGSLTYKAIIDDWKENNKNLIEEAN